MKPDVDPAIVSLETHRRKRQADERKREAERRKQARARPAGANPERAINWRRVPLLLAVVVAFLVISWLLRQAGGLLNPFH
jgi:hypothetical protein